MVSERSHTDAPTAVKDNNKTTAASKLGKAKLVFIHENNNGNTKLAKNGLKSNNTLGVNILEGKEGWFYGWADKYDAGMINPIHLQKKMNQGAHTHSGVTTIFLNSPKPNTMGDQKQDS